MVRRGDTRPLRRCLAVLALTLASALPASALAKPTIAVLGLEVISADEGSLDEPGTQVAKNLTSALRRRAALGLGKYQLAPNSQKDLLELKLLSDCADENRDCMSAIGRELGAQRLLYGKIERQPAGFQVSLRLLNVGTRSIERTISDVFSMAQLQGGVDELGRRLYNQLTGVPETGAIAIRTNASTGSVFIDGRPAATLSAGQATLRDLAEGSHSLVVDASGHQRYRGTVTVVSGEVQQISIRLPIEAVPAEDSRPGGVSRVLFWSTLTIAGASGAAFAVTGLQVRGSLKEDKDDALRTLCTDNHICLGTDIDACAEAEAMNQAMPSDNLRAVVDACEKGRSRALLANVFLGTSITATLAASYFFYRGYVASARSRRDEMVRESRRGRRRSFALNPSLAPGHLGADLRIEF